MATLNKIKFFKVVLCAMIFLPGFSYASHHTLPLLAAFQKPIQEQYAELMLSNFQLNSYLNGLLSLSTSPNQNVPAGVICSTQFLTTVFPQFSTEQKMHALKHIHAAIEYRIREGEATQSQEALDRRYEEERKRPDTELSVSDSKEVFQEKLRRHIQHLTDQLGKIQNLFNEVSI